MNKDRNQSHEKHESGMRVKEGLKVLRTSTEEKMDEAVQNAEERSHPSDPY